MSAPDIALMQAVVVGPADPDIVACEARLRAAQLGADVAALDALIADELLFTGPDGQLGTKAQDLESHGSGVVRFRGHAPEELRMRRVGPGVVVTALRARLRSRWPARWSRAPIATRACGPARPGHGAWSAGT
jgi:hypothetical protein